MSDGWKIVYQIDEMIQEDIEETQEKRQHAVGPMEEIDLMTLEAYQRSVLARLNVLLTNERNEAAHALREAVARGKAVDNFKQAEREVYGECPHGDDPAECNECMKESDHAYDASREDRVFGRSRGRD